MHDVSYYVQYDNKTLTIQHRMHDNIIGISHAL